MPLTFENQNLLQLLTEMAPVSCVVLPINVSEKRKHFIKILKMNALFLVTEYLTPEEDIWYFVEKKNIKASLSTKLVTVNRSIGRKCFIYSNYGSFSL